MFHLFIDNKVEQAWPYPAKHYHENQARSANLLKKVCLVPVKLLVIN